MLWPTLPIILLLPHSPTSLILQLLSDSAAARRIGKKAVRVARLQLSFLRSLSEPRADCCTSEYFLGAARWLRLRYKQLNSFHSLVCVLKGSEWFLLAIHDWIRAYSMRLRKEVNAPFSTKGFKPNDQLMCKVRSTVALALQPSLSLLPSLISWFSTKGDSAPWGLCRRSRSGCLIQSRRGGTLRCALANRIEPITVVRESRAHQQAMAQAIAGERQSGAGGSRSAAHGARGG